MAIYQFQLQFIPRAWAEAHNFLPEALYTENGFETVYAWADHPPLKNPDLWLSGILPPAKSWHQDLTCWGSDKCHDIQLWRDGGSIEEIQVRFDLREKIGPLLVQVVKAAIELQCALFLPGQKTVIDPNVFILKRLADNSEAAKFAQNPTAYLREISST